MHLINHCDKANGHVNVSVDLACTQSRMGHQVAFTCARGDYIDLLESYGVQVFHACEPHRNIRQFFESGRLIWRAVRAFRPDVIHIHMAAQAVMAQPLRMFGYKTVTTVHNEFDRSVWLMGLASRIVMVSEAGAAAMRRRGFSRKAVRVVINGTIGTPRLPENFTPASIGRPAIITVCGMHRRKGVVDLIHAFKQVVTEVPGAHLHLVGEGPEQADYERLAETLGVSRTVHFLGYRADPRQYLKASDIFVLASHADPGPLVIAEARNAGCAIVATNVGGIPEMLDFGAAGILVEPRRPDQLAQAMLKLLKDPEVLAEYSQLAKANVERFTVGRVCRDLDAIYTELASEPNTVRSAPACADVLTKSQDDLRVDLTSH
jgi:glycosyltransferase involved in cell wall biosynthesis